MLQNAQFTWWFRANQLNSFELAKKMYQSDKITDFVTQLGKWISAAPEPFDVKFARNVEKLFP